MTHSYEVLAPILNAIAELFPAVFTVERWQEHKPLKIGIHRDLVERGILTPAEAKVLRLYVSRRMYQQALAASGPRYDLDGNVAGEVTAEQASAAARSVAAIDASRAAKATEVRKMQAHTLRRNAKPRVWKVLPEPTPEPRGKPVEQPAPAPQRLSLAGLKAAAQARRQASTEAVR